MPRHDDEDMEEEAIDMPPWPEQTKNRIMKENCVRAFIGNDIWSKLRSQRA
jgi:hypothetical protein